MLQGDDSNPMHGANAPFAGWMDALHEPARWDIIVANVGHHAAAGAEHWTYEEYRTHVEAYIGAFKRRLGLQRSSGGSNASLSRFIWMASHAMPTARDNQIMGSGDWRTNQRLALYERFARHEVLQMQHELGHERCMYHDAFNLTLPYIEAAAGDCGHFSGANVQMALVQGFLNLVCPQRGHTSHTSVQDTV